MTIKRREYESYDKYLKHQCKKLDIALKKKVADTILISLGGHGAAQKVEGKFLHGHMVDPELIKVLKENGRKSAEACGDLADG